ncbi:MULTISPECIES: hypothetical protein [Solibacillus]|uniref:Lipoprotein n=1 Tax=Solibacillus merdavium TaxID=2762218 RepID=A0ABR8XLF8_9BACL|nr:hypothetical protein [Solibacillus merdavium]MBD8032781.1 hypothetical protein [Solibacillus merdavium]
MRKLFLLMVLFLAGCADPAEESKWVGEALPNEPLEEIKVQESKVPIYTPTSNTVGYVIKQQKRDKWLLVNAEQVASHPYSLVHHDLLNLGETYAIDVEHNIAIIHIRNSYDYLIEDISTYETKLNEKDIIAEKQHIDALLKKAITEKMDWQERLQKNKQLLDVSNQQPIENFTDYYNKNIFTYNVDDLRASAVNLIEKLNKYIDERDEALITDLIRSDDILKEIQYLTKSINGFEIKEARKDGFYYYVNGADDQKNDIRLTLIKEGQRYKLIGANFLSDEFLNEEKIPHIQFDEKATYDSLPGLQMFVNNNLPAIKITVDKLTWSLKHEDKKVAVSNGTANFNCAKVTVIENDLILNSCENTKNKNYIIASFKE